MKQTTFASLAYAHKGKRTRRERFLAEMDAVIPWARLVALIEPHYPKPTGGRGGRVALPPETKLRVYCLQQFHDLSDPGAEEALYDSDAMRLLRAHRAGAGTLPACTACLRSPTCTWQDDDWWRRRDRCAPMPRCGPRTGTKARKPRPKCGSLATLSRRNGSKPLGGGTDQRFLMRE